MIILTVCHLLLAPVRMDVCNVYTVKKHKYWARVEWFVAWWQCTQWAGNVPYCPLHLRHAQGAAHCASSRPPLSRCGQQILCCWLVSLSHSVTHLSLQGSLFIKSSQAVVRVQRETAPVMCIHSLSTAQPCFLLYLSVTVQRNRSASEAPHLLTLARAATAAIISVMRGEGLERQQWHSGQRYGGGWGG